MVNRGVSDAENVRAECYALGIKDFDAFLRFLYVSADETALGVAASPFRRVAAGTRNERLQQYASHAQKADSDCSRLSEFGKAVSRCGSLTTLLHARDIGAHDLLAYRPQTKLNCCFFRRANTGRGLCRQFQARGGFRITTRIHRSLPGEV